MTCYVQAVFVVAIIVVIPTFTVDGSVASPEERR
jgi:hypothetical protein